MNAVNSVQSNQRTSLASPTVSTSTEDQFLSMLMQEFALTNAMSPSVSSALTSGSSTPAPNLLPTLIATLLLENSSGVNNTMGGATVPGSGSGGAVSAPGQGGTSRVPDITALAKQASQAYGVPTNLILGVIHQESGGNPSAVSSAGALGLMQLMPATAKGLGVTNAFDPLQNIMAGTHYLAIQLERYHGNTSLALAAYNAGPGAVAQYGGVPPYPQTIQYIKDVTGYADALVTASSNQAP